MQPVIEWLVSWLREPISGVLTRCLWLD